MNNKSDLEKYIMRSKFAVACEGIGILLIILIAVIILSFHINWIPDNILYFFILFSFLVGPFLKFVGQKINKNTEKADILAEKSYHEEIDQSVYFISAGIVLSGKSLLCRSAKAYTARIAQRWRWQRKTAAERSDCL